MISLKLPVRHIAGSAPATSCEAQIDPGPGWPMPWDLSMTSLVVDATGMRLER